MDPLLFAELPILVRDEYIFKSGAGKPMPQKDFEHYYMNRIQGPKTRTEILKADRTSGAQLFEGFVARVVEPRRAGDQIPALV
jgi:hypothetical protein